MNTLCSLSTWRIKPIISIDVSYSWIQSQSSVTNDFAHAIGHSIQLSGKIQDLSVDNM